MASGEGREKPDTHCDHLIPTYKEPCKYCMDGSISLEAFHVTHGPRAKTYGEPLDNHGRTAAFWSTYLGISITPEQVCMLNILQKISRSIHSITRDTLIDTSGYSENVDMIWKEREKRRVGNSPDTGEK